MLHIRVVLLFGILLQNPGTVWAIRYRPTRESLVGSPDKAMKIGIIGAGVSGLVSAKYSLEYGYEATIFEQSGEYGGIWRYTDKIGFDNYGVPIHSAMYKYLKTNLPKEIMLLRGLDHINTTKSYVSQPFILDYLERYVEKFNILTHIKFRHQVLRVHPLEGGKWKVFVKNVIKNIEEVYVFDALMVCNGHYYKTSIPEISGMKEFSGLHLHSRDYRIPEIFQNQTVVVVGAGPSGVDIAKHIATKANKVYVSRKPNSKWQLPEADNIFIKPEILSFSQNGCHFEDGTYEDVDSIIYCTGYKYDFPFLTEESGITVEDNTVKHIYRHLINIEHSTMSIVGLIFGVTVFPMVDLSARYFLAHLSGEFSLPGKEAMLECEMEEQNIRRLKGWPQRYAHKSPDFAEELATAMAEEARLEKIPSVIFELHKFITKKRSTDLCYKVVDDETFVQIACNE